MKRKIYLILALLSGMVNLPEAGAQESTSIVPDVSIQAFTMNRNGKYLTVEMGVDLDALKVSVNRAVLLTPRLVNGTDSLNLPAIGIYGRQRYYYYLRNGISTISGETEKSFRASKKPSQIDYGYNVPFEEWMDGATLKLHRSDWGCCNTILSQYEGALGQHLEAFFPELVFVQPQAEMVKSRSLSGSAFIDFPVDQTIIYPDYRQNTHELGKIQATIDSVRNDNDITITSVWLKGYASPESPYKHNTELAIGRTAALKKHIGQLYKFDENVILTEYEPEDWAGLRRYVDQTNISHRTEILALIDSDMDPDEKELKIKKSFPEEYKFLLQNCYPALRHTDYRIDYNIRQFNNADEIERIMAKEPQKLSLNEFYLVSGKYEPGTDEFTHVFETAVRLFPHDETANLNAANAAIRRDDFAIARRYLAKAGGSAEAFYARGSLAVREGDYDTARQHFMKAKEMGLEQAGKTLEELNKREK